MIAPIREMESCETEDRPLLSETARTVAARLLPQIKQHQDAPTIPTWQAWLLVTWLVATALAYVAITLGIWKS